MTKVWGTLTLDSKILSSWIGRPIYDCEFDLFSRPVNDSDGVFCCEIHKKNMWNNHDVLTFKRISHSLTSRTVSHVIKRNVFLNTNRTCNSLWLLMKSLNGSKHYLCQHYCHTFHNVTETGFQGFIEKKIKIFI